MAGAHRVIGLGRYAREIREHIVEIFALMHGNERLQNGTRTCCVNVRRKILPAARALAI
jgi:hypothetical protein